MVVFYNGGNRIAEEETLLLSRSFPPGAKADIEVRVRLININPGMGDDIKDVCEPLREYVWIVERIKENLSGMSDLNAIDEAIDAMPESFVIKPYLLAHKAEVRDMLLTEYNEAEAMELFREEGREEGRLEGREEAMAESLTNLIRNMRLTAHQAMDVLGVPEAERARYLALL